MPCCRRCGAKLSNDEIGLHLKLVSRASREFLCIRCLGAYFRIPEQRLREMIEQFRAQGCTLFR